MVRISSHHCCDCPLVMILNLCVTCFLYSAPCFVLYNRFALYKYSIIIIALIIFIIIVCGAFGGIYLDTDEVLLQPVDDLLQHHVTMAWEKPNQSFGNGLFLAEPNNTFLNAWYDKYRKFTNTWWTYFSTTVPRQLYSQHPEMNIHIVDTFFRPNLWNITRLVYQGRYDWSNHYAMHLYYRRNQKYFRGNFEQRNTTLGEIARHILFGDKKRCV